jgi:hypothetical protein
VIDDRISVAVERLITLIGAIFVAQPSEIIAWHADTQILRTRVMLLPQLTVCHAEQFRFHRQARSPAVLCIGDCRFAAGVIGPTPSTKVAHQGTIVAALLKYRGTYWSVLWFEIAMVDMKLIAKPLRPLFAMPIPAADLVLDVLFDLSAYSLGNLRR